MYSFYEVWYQMARNKLNEPTSYSNMGYFRIEKPILGVDLWISFY